MNLHLVGFASRRSVLLARCNNFKRLLPSHILAAITLAALVLLSAAAPAAAQATHVGSGAPLAKPAKVDSFVKTSDGKFLWDGVTPFVGTNYTGTLATFPGTLVDVVMQQCFGGGFHAGMNAALGGVKNYTFTAATTWNELAWNQSTYALVGAKSAATITSVDNFTRAWNQSIPRNEGLYQHYLDATAGAAAAPLSPPSPGILSHPGVRFAASRTRFLRTPPLRRPMRSSWGIPTRRA